MKSTPKSDYMKHWKIVRNFAKARYDFSVPDLDMMFFLYGEEYFTKDKYREFEKLLRWESNRFDKLLKNGWIENYKKKKYLPRALYGTTYKTTRVIGSLYKKLNGEPYPESYQSNPLYFKTKVPLSHKLYGKYIKKINASIEQQRRRSLE
jgi:CDP-diacylglycerol pyrophosphatase